MKQKIKIALIGAGNIGGTIALLAGVKELGDVVLVDVAEGLAKGKALDLSHAAAALGSSTAYAGSTDYSAIQDADVCIVTAGVARRPGMSRDDLLSTNAEIMRSVAQGIKHYAPASFVIVVSNPLDIMAAFCQRLSGLPPEKVIGMAGVLDSARYRSFLADECGVSPSSIQALVLGGHGDEMLPLRSCTTINGAPVSLFIADARLDAIETRVRNAGAEVVALLRSGSAYYSPAASALEMAESYLKDSKKLLACSAFLRGEYGVHNLYAGVPVIIGNAGVERIVELKLTSEEQAAFSQSIRHIKELWEKVSLAC